MASAPTPSRPYRIAVADDDAQMRSLVAESLRKDGYTVVELRDGARLLVEVARQFRTRERGAPLDLVVSDIRMPVVTGLAILKGLREAHSPLPVVLMTAFGDERTRAEVERLGGRMLDKPFRMEALRIAVAELLAQGPPTPAA